jgi:hypothetical protein
MLIMFHSFDPFLKPYLPLVKNAWGQILGVCVNGGLDYLLDLNVDEFN